MNVSVVTSYLLAVDILSFNPNSMIMLSRHIEYMMLHVSKFHLN